MKKDDLLKKINEKQQESASLELSGIQFRRECDKALALLIPFIDNVGSSPASSEKTETSIAKQLSANNFYNEADPIHQLIITQLKGGIETASGNFMGYIPGGGLLSGALADLVTAITNRFSGFHFAAPGSAESENKVIHWLCDLFQLGDDAWGSLTSGATMATLNCFLAARESVSSTLSEKLVIYQTSQTHFATDRTLKAMGISNQAIHVIPTDNHLGMNLEALEHTIKTDLQEGKKPFLMVANAGSTNTGTIDPLNDMAFISKKYGLWLHVDAAYGGFFQLCAETKHLLQGIEKADSIVVDPHKGLFLSYGIGAGLVKHHHFLKNALKEEAPFLSREETPSDRSPADYSFELTRHNRAPRVELSLQLFGVSAISACLSEKYLLAKWLYEELKEIKELTVFAEPALTIVVFRCKNDHETRNLLDYIVADGVINVSSTQIQEQLWIRACILSFRTHKEHVQSLVDRIILFKKQK